MVPRLFWICKNWWCFSLFLFCKFCWKNPFGVLVLINLPAIYSRDLKPMTFLVSVKTQKISRRASEGEFPHPFMLFGKPWVVSCLHWATSFVFLTIMGPCRLLIIIRSTNKTMGTFWFCYCALQVSLKSLWVRVCFELEAWLWLMGCLISKISEQNQGLTIGILRVCT